MKDSRVLTATNTRLADKAASIGIEAASVDLLAIKNKG
jgi:hypothetical protein